MQMVGDRRRCAYLQAALNMTSQLELRKFEMSQQKRFLSEYTNA